VSIRPDQYAAAAPWLACVVPRPAANPGGLGGGTATNAGAMPAPTLAAHVWKAVSTAAAALGVAKADARDESRTADAAATVVDAGTTAAA
jgi:hypothetical protein